MFDPFQVQTKMNYPYLHEFYDQKSWIKDESDENEKRWVFSM